MARFQILTCDEVLYIWLPWRPDAPSQREEAREIKSERDEGAATEDAVTQLVTMTKVYPNAAAPADEVRGALSSSSSGRSESMALTVWKKSLLFNCSGFTVFDSKGSLLFRVDNYATDHRGEVVLMDASGQPLRTLRRKRLSLGDQWLVFDGEVSLGVGRRGRRGGSPTRPPKFHVKKQGNFLGSRSLAHVSCCHSKAAFYDIEGSYAQRCCTVYDEKRRKVAEVKRKEAASGGVAFGADVFRLIVQPEMDAADAMALVLLLDQMFTSRWSSAAVPI
ncbi:protein LURP-one-related 8-like [Nymphaea colorata]|nr:protein LURP-one-related 8-like [Nymphaea colorata]